MVTVMEIEFLRQFWFTPKYYTDQTVHKHYGTIRFANRPNIDAQIWLTIFSPGASWDNGAITAMGTAATGIKSCAFVNDQDEIEVQEFTTWKSSIRVERVVDLTVALNVRLAWAGAEGMIHYWK
jgi:hypothetical protein